MSVFVKFGSVALVAALVLGPVVRAQESLSNQPGISPTKPESGPSVQVEGGYMVPYTLQVPGSDVAWEMIPIPGGVVTLGSPESEAGHQADEGPQIKVTVGPMWVAKCETTWKEYKLYMSMYRLFKSLANSGLRKATPTNAADAVTAPTELYDRTFTFEFGEDDNLPATTMTQYSAKQYTKWLSKLTGQQYRLPTEAEWEYACRAGSNAPFGFGGLELVDDYGWFSSNCKGISHPVGKKDPNAWGLYDMHGNVMEWCSDWAGDYPEGAVIDPIGPQDGDSRMIRGGAWLTPAMLGRSGNRAFHFPPDTRSDYVGFRVALSSPEIASQSTQSQDKSSEAGRN